MKIRKKSKRIKILNLSILILLVVGTLVINLIDSPEVQQDDGILLSESSYDNLPLKDLPLHTYDWTNLSEENGKKHYKDSTGLEASIGIDVSIYQEDIDWNKVKNDNIDYAIIRTGYRGYESGKLVADEKFEENMSGALNAGIDVGVYFFSQAITMEEVREEAQFVLDSIKNYDITYPVVFDMEVTDTARILNLTIEERTNLALEFSRIIEEAGYTPMIYGNPSWFTDMVSLEDLIEYDIWLANYADKPDFTYEFEMWQYTDTGTVDGISGDVDINLSFKKYVDTEE